MYKLYGAIERESKTLPRGKLLPIVYHELDDALGAACNLNARGGTALLIEGDDGTHLAKSEIIRIVDERRAELAGRPKVY
jgi:hypothetical protein